MSAASPPEQASAPSRNRTTHPDDAEREALDIRPERAQVGAEQVRQHVDALVDEVDGRAARRSLGVHGVVRVHKVRDVGDVCAGAREREGGQSRRERKGR